MNRKSPGFCLILCLLIIDALASVAYGEDTKGSADTAVIHAGLLLQIPGQAPKSEQTLVVEAGRIKSVQDGFLSPAEIGLSDPGIKVIDLRDKFVLPGLIDAHVHLTVRNDDKRNRALLTGEETLMEGVINARTTLLAGVTTVRDVGAAGRDAWSIFVLRDAVRDGKIPGPRIVAAGSIISATGGHGDRRLDADKSNSGQSSPGVCDDAASCRQVVRRQFRQGSELIKISVTGGGGERNGGKNDDPAFFPDELSALVDTAHSLNLKVAAHGHGTAGINAALKAGVDSIEHGSFLDDESISLFKKNNAYLVPTLSVQDRIKREVEAGNDPDYLKERKQLFLVEHPANVGKAYKAGVKIAMGTDAGVVPHGANAHELEWYVTAGLSEMDAIVTATVNAAALLELEDEVGTLEPGKAADIIAVSSDPTENISALKNIAFVMKNGITYNADSW